MWICGILIKQNIAYGPGPDVNGVAIPIYIQGGDVIHLLMKSVASEIATSVAMEDHLANYTQSHSLTDKKDKKKKKKTVKKESSKKRKGSTKKKLPTKKKRPQSDSENWTPGAPVERKKRKRQMKKKNNSAASPEPPKKRRKTQSAPAISCLSLVFLF